jgi:type II secretory pathway component PulL
VNVVVVGQSLNRRWLEACHSVPHAGGETIATAIQQAVVAVGGMHLPCISAVAARDISFHSLLMPFTSVAKIRRVIAYELEPRLLSPLEEVQFDLCAARSHGDQTTVMVAVVWRRILDQFLAGFRAHHLDLVAVDVRNHALATQLLTRRAGQETLLLLDLDDGVLTLCHQGAVVLHRPLRQGGQGTEEAPGSDKTAVARQQHLLTAVMTTLHAYGVDHGLDLAPTRVVLTGEGMNDQALADLFAAGLKSEVVALDLAAELGIACSLDMNGQWLPQAMGTALALALRGSRANIGFNFLTGDYQPVRGGLPYAREMRKAVLWSTLLLALLALDQGLEYQALSQRYHDLDQQTRQIFQRVFPAAQLKVDPLLQMRAMMKAEQKAQGADAQVSGLTILDLLQEISARTSMAWKVQVVSLLVDADTIQIKGITDNFNTVDALKQELAASPKVKEVTISSATLDRQNSVAFELRMRKGL